MVFLLSLVFWANSAQKNPNNVGNGQNANELFCRGIVSAASKAHVVFLLHYTAAKTHVVFLRIFPRSLIRRSVIPPSHFGGKMLARKKSQALVPRRNR